MTIQIRLAESQDLDRIIELQTYSIKTLISGEYNCEQVEALAKDQQQYRGSNETIFLAECNGQLVGFASLLWIDLHPIIGSVYIHPKFVRKGIGRQLVATIENMAIAKNYKILKVTASLTAVPFYQAQGYKIIRKTGFWTYTGVWIPCIKLEKQLSSPTALEMSSTPIVFVCLFVISFLITLIQL